MAVIWQASRKGVHYEVRRAGASVRLYTDGVFHSQWNPQRPLAGHLWDLLFLPALFSVKAPKLDRILVLGVGGGAVINAFCEMLSVNHIDGVDLDPLHLRIAKRFFVQSRNNVALLEDDAQRYVEQANKVKYDVIVEDLFCGALDDPSDAVRLIAVDKAWLNALNKRLTDHGVLAINFENEAQMRGALRPKVYRSAGFHQRVFFRHNRYENVIAVLFNGRANSEQEFTQMLASLRKRFPVSATRDLHYQLVKR